MSKPGYFIFLAREIDESECDAGGKNVKKLLIISSNFPFGIGEEFLETEIHGLLSQGFKVFVCPLRKMGQIRKSKILDHIEIISLNYWRMNFFDLIKYFSKVAFFGRRDAWGSIPELMLRLSKESIAAGLSRQLAQHLIENPVSHIHAYWASSTSTLAMQTSKILNIPWSFSAHSGDIYDGLNLVEKASTSQKIRFSSSIGSDIYQKKVDVPLNYSVIRHGTSINSEYTSLPRVKMPALRIVCVANLIEIKGHRFLFESLAILKAIGTSVKLFLVGQGPLENELRELQDDLELNAEIIFMGYLPQARLFELYANNAFDLMVLPSGTAPSGQQEGTPVSLIEAASYGIPLISTNTGAISDLIPANSGGLVPEGNAQVLAQRIQEFALMNDDEYQSRCKMFQSIAKSKFDASITSVEFATFFLNAY